MKLEVTGDVKFPDVVKESTNIDVLSRMKLPKLMKPIREHNNRLLKLPRLTEDAQSKEWDEYKTIEVKKNMYLKDLEF